MKVGGLKYWCEVPVCTICRDHCVTGGDRGAGYVECRPLGYGAALCVSRSRVRNISALRGDTQEKCAQPCVHLYKHTCTVAKPTRKMHKAFCKWPFILFRMTRTFEFRKPICQSLNFLKEWRFGLQNWSRNGESNKRTALNQLRRMWKRAIVTV
jgi:hypothetical protein